MRWPSLPRHQLAGVLFALLIVVSLVGMQAASLELFATKPGSDATADGGNVTNPVRPNATRQRTDPATINCTDISARPQAAQSGSSLRTNHTVRASPPPRSIAPSRKATGTAPAVNRRPSTAGQPTNATRRFAPRSLRETCRLIERFTPPEWVTELAATGPGGAAASPTDGAAPSLAAYSNRTDRAAAQLALARDLRAILTDDARSRRGATFAAAATALAERKQMHADRNPTGSVTPQLAAQQTKLRSAHALLTAAETDRGSQAGTLTRSASLTEQGLEVQVARLHTDTQPTDPTNVTLPDTTMPEHDAPSAAAFAILAAQNVEVTSDQAADIRSLDELPEPTRRELTDVLDAYLNYYRTTQASVGANEPRVRAAQLQLHHSAADLETTLETTANSGSAGRASNETDDPGVHIPGVVLIDLTQDDNTYEQDFNLQVDAGGDDIYNNNAGGANASGNSTDAAALIDLGGADTYNGRNGGARYIRTKASPSVPDPRVPLPKKGEAAGFLLDAGSGNDTYTASNHNGTNGGGRRATGFLVDTGGHDTYDGSGKGTNGAAYKKGTGFLLDAGTGNDTYAGGDDGVSNAGTNGGRGFLFDVGGNDTYNGSNGGAHRAVFDSKIVKTILGTLPDPLTVPESGGFLLDGGGSDTYNGANGGASRRSSGFLLDEGTGDDRYVGKNGAANIRAAGFLLDLGGTDSYISDRSSTRNGAGYSDGVGFLMDGGSGNDTYNATTGGGPVARQRSQYGPGSLGANGGGWMGGHGFLVDSGGNDAYLAGSVGTNGGATSGDGDHPPGLPNPKNSPTGFLLDASGDDRYEAGHSGANGGGYGGVGLLYDNSGTDNYTDRFHRCIDCSDVPKGAIGAQVDGGGGRANSRRRTGPTEVLVVDDSTASGAADCPDASYEDIQPAVDAAEPGDTVRVCAGTYPGNVTVNTRNVRVEAAAPGQVVLDGENERRVGVALVAEETTVTGITATNFATGFTAVRPANTVKNAKSINNSRGIIVAGVYSGGALQALPGTAASNDGKNPTVIADNAVTGGKHGITVHGTGNVRVASNTVTATQHGIAVTKGMGVRIQNNTVSGQGVPPSKHQGGIASVRSWDITMTGNRVTGFTAPADWQNNGAFSYGYGIQIRGGVGGKDGSHTLRNNRLADNRFNLQVQVPKANYRHLTIPPSNTVNGKPVVYLVGAVGATISNDGISDLTVNSSLVPGTNMIDTQQLEDIGSLGYLACIRCVDVTVRDLELSHNGHGVLIVQSKGVEVTNVTVNDTVHGVGLRDSPTNIELTDTTVQDTNIAIRVAHNCHPRKGGARGAHRCANPSVLVAHNTVRRASMGFEDFGRGEGSGGAIMVRGRGVTVRQNAISNVRGAGISVRGGKMPASQWTGLLGGVINRSSGPIFSSTVRENSISDAEIGITVKRTQDTIVGANTISNADIGLFTLENNGATYRANIVTNTTTGMFVHWREVDLSARNNTFRDVRWGLDGRFLFTAKPPWGPGTHDFGTTNTVNGERIIWLTGATERTIDAADANMVACIRCVNVTIRDMTLTDNSHGVMLWDSTSTLVTNVTATDTFRTGVLIRGGENNTVRDSTIIDSTDPIWVYPIKFSGNQVVRRGYRNGPGPIGVNDETRNLRETVGPVRIVNNRITVDDASWPQVGMPYWARAFNWYYSWGHHGISLIMPTEATVKGNNVTDNNWGVYLWGRQVSDIRIVNNTVTNPKTEQGFARFGATWARWGVRVFGSTNGDADSSLSIRNNTLTASPAKGIGIKLTTYQGVIPQTEVVNNNIHGYKKGLALQKGQNNTTVSIRRNRFVGAKSASVKVVGSPAGETVDIHQNLLDPLRFGFGVKYKTGSGGGHMGSESDSSGGDTPHIMMFVDARCNRWAAPSGPSSQRLTLVDPVTGEPANGNGSTVSRGHMHDMSNVRFHPWLGNSPGRTCDQALVGTATPTPTPGPTRTPWPTVGSGAGLGSGSGDGPGAGSGEGPGNGSSDGGGTGQVPGTAAGGGTATSTVTARLPVQSTQTATPPSTATPEVVPGFGAGVWLIAFALVMGLLLGARRRY